MDFPTITDGRRGVRSPIVRCYSLLSGNAPRRYHYVSDDIKATALAIDHTLEGDGAHLGSFSRKSTVSGTVNIQLDRADDPVPDAGHVLSLTKRVNGVDVESFYVVREPGQPNERNNVVRCALGVVAIVNPVLTGLLSADLGDTKQQTFSKATMGTTETIATSGRNTRTGATVTYSATQQDGTALPAGVAINASTGVITVTKADVAEASYAIAVVCQDVLSTLPTDHPMRTRQGEALLLLTVTA